MKEIAIEVLNIIYNHGYVAYIVGGFVRNSLLGIDSNDIDLTTNATPMELKNIFNNIEIPNTSYGSVTLIYKKERFEITTYRQEDNYIDNRHPASIKYVNDLKTDLLRRDFTINAICLDKDGQLIDLLNGQEDLKKRVVQTINNSDKSFKDDCLRILRAIRFATTLNFKLSDEVIKSIQDNKSLLKKLSYQRKKQELDYIFASNYAKEGIELLKKMDLINVLELNNITRVCDYSDLMGIWSMINSPVYTFSSNEKELIKKVNIVYELDNMDSKVLYLYGPYINTLAGVNKGLNKKDIMFSYDSLPIKTRSDIMITAQEMCLLLNKKPGKFINDIYLDLENKILENKLINDSSLIKEYIENNY